MIGNQLVFDGSIKNVADIKEKKNMTVENYKLRL